MLILLADGWSQDPKDPKVGWGPVAARCKAVFGELAEVRHVSCGTDLTAIVLERLMRWSEVIVGGGFSYGGGRWVRTLWELQKLLDRGALPYPLSARVRMCLRLLLLVDARPRLFDGQFQDFPLLGPGCFRLPKIGPNFLAIAYFQRNDFWIKGLPLRQADWKFCANENHSASVFKHGDMIADYALQEEYFRRIEDIVEGDV